MVQLVTFAIAPKHSDKANSNLIQDSVTRSDMYTSTTGQEYTFGFSAEQTLLCLTLLTMDNNDIDRVGMTRYADSRISIVAFGSLR